MRFTEESLQATTARVVSQGAGMLSFKPAKRSRSRANGPTPHDILWLAIEERWPGRAQREYLNAVPDRRFRIDIAFPADRLACESDGWAWHGRHLGDFVRDRERQNLLCIHGWRVLRFSAGMVRRELDKQLEIIEVALSANSVGIVTSTAL